MIGILSLIQALTICFALGAWRGDGSIDDDLEVHMNATTKSRWLVDSALFTGFIVCFFLDLTGVVLHQWLGIAGGIVAAYHLLSHWNWVEAVTRRFFGKTSGQARQYYVLNAVLLVGISTIVGTGLAISTWFGQSLSNYAAVHTVHILASIITLCALVVKIGLHSHWIVSATRKFFTAPATSKRGTLPASAVSVSTRRDFLKVMGIVGVASLFAVNSSVQSLQDASGAQTGTSGTTSTANTTATNQGASASANSSVANQYIASTCTVSCSRGCSYPGHCRKYTDSNSNGRCDWGECLS